MVDFYRWLNPVKTAPRKQWIPNRALLILYYISFFQIVKCENCWGPKTTTFPLPLSLSAFSTEPTSLQGRTWADSESEERDRWRRERETVRKRGDKKKKTEKERWPVIAQQRHTSQSFITTRSQAIKVLKAPRGETDVAVTDKTVLTPGSLSAVCSVWSLFSLVHLEQKEGSLSDVNGGKISPRGGSKFRR